MARPLLLGGGVAGARHLGHGPLGGCGWERARLQVCIGMLCGHVVG